MDNSGKYDPEVAMQLMRDLSVDIERLDSSVGSEGDSSSCIEGDSSELGIILDDNFEDWSEDELIHFAAQREFEFLLRRLGS
jgi:hypothetical protein